MEAPIDDSCPAFQGTAFRGGSSNLPAAEVLDQKHLSQLQAMQVPGRGSLFSELVVIFRKEAPSKLESLCRAVASHDADQIARLAHALVGSLATLGARQMQCTVRALESVSASGDWPLIERTHAEVLIAWKNLHEALSSLPHKEGK